FRGTECRRTTVTGAPRTIPSDVTVIVPTMGGAVLQGCLESIAAGTVWPARVVVVDQGGLEATGSSVDAVRARGLQVLHLRSTQSGISAATNRGLEHVQSPYAAITHDDCRVRPDWLDSLTASLAWGQRA